MQFVSAGTSDPAHMEPQIEKRHGLPLRSLIRFVLPNQNLNLLSKEAADGGGTAGG
jgi:hypothetical protein